MTVNNSRPLRASMLNGTTDGKYRKARPDTELTPGMGDRTVEENREGLHPFFNYGFITSEAPTKVSPGV
jgi:hypothetical protein